MGLTADQQIYQYSVEPFHKMPGETEVSALKRILADYVSRGWQIVDSCGDEVRMPVLIFEKVASDAAKPEYLVEQVPHAKGHDDVADVRERLWSKKEDNWMPVCVMDSPVTTPVAVFKKAEQPIENLLVKVIEVTPTLLEKVAEAIVYELLDQQVRDNLSLKCVMHGGINPVLVMITKDTDQPYEYLVEHAKGGIFKNQTRKLTELIEARSAEGWQVCGAFEDSFFWPCVIFHRSTEEMPVAPREVAEQAEAMDQST